MGERERESKRERKREKQKEKEEKTNGVLSVAFTFALLKSSLLIGTRQK